MDITPSHIELLRTTFDAVKGINPSGSAYKNLVAFLDNLSQSSLKKLSNARIKFVSPLAKNRLNEDKIPGGLAKGMSLNDIAEKHNVDIEVLKKEFVKGVKTEMEHTTDKEVAKEIALDHIFEDPKYYTKLATIEEDWSDKYKRSIDCNNPKGFSQKAHCQGREKREGINERAQQAVSGGKVHKNITGFNLPYKGRKYKEIDMEVKKIDNKTEKVLLRILNPKNLFGQQVEVTFKELRRGPFMKTDTSKDVKENTMKSLSEMIKEITIEEKLNLFTEKNVPTDPGKWAYYKAQAKKKFDVYPSAYANGWAAKQYKAAGGGWRTSKSESLEEACWVGYKQVGMKDKSGKMVPNCVKEITEIFYEENGKGHGYTFEYIRENDLNEAEYQGREVKLGKPMQGDVKKFKVYVKNPEGNVVKVNFGHKGKDGEKTMRIRKSNPEARKNFRARHNCDNPGPRHKARYWSCRKW